MYYVSSHPAPKPGSVFDLQSLARDKHKTGFPFLHYFTHLTSHCEVQPILYISFLFFPPSLRCFKSPWMEPGLRCTIFPATVAVVLGPVQPHYFWEPNSHGPRNRRASSAFLALFPGIVSFVTSRAAFQPVNVCAGRSKFPVFSFRKGNLKFRMQPLFFFFLRKLCFFLFYFSHFCSLLWYSIYSDNNTINLFKMHLFCMRRNHKIPPPANGSAGVSHLYFIITLDQLKLNLLSFLTIQGIYPSKVNLHVTTFHLMSCEISPPLILPDTTRSPDYTRLITK